MYIRKTEKYCYIKNLQYMSLETKIIHLTCMRRELDQEYIWSIVILTLKIKTMGAFSLR